MTADPPRAGATPEVPGLPVVWRPRLGRWVPHVLLVVVAGLLVWMGYFMAAEVRPRDLVLFALIGSLALVGLYLLGRPQLVAREGGLVIVNIWHRQELEWAQVVRVHMVEGEPWPTIDLVDGTTLATMGIQASDGARAGKDLAVLQALVAEHGTASEPADPEAGPGPAGA